MSGNISENRKKCNISENQKFGNDCKVGKNFAGAFKPVLKEVFPPNCKDNNKVAQVDQVVPQVPQVPQVVPQVSEKTYEVWLSTKDAAELLSCTERAVRKNPHYKSKKTTGKSGKERRYLLSSLPAAAQEKYEILKQVQDDNKNGFTPYTYAGGAVNSQMSPSAFFDGEKGEILRYSQDDKGIDGAMTASVGTSLIPLQTKKPGCEGPAHSLAVDISDDIQPLVKLGPSFLCEGNMKREKDQKLALARYELVKLWEGYVKNSCSKLLPNYSDAEKAGQILTLVRNEKITKFQIIQLINVSIREINNRIKSGEYEAIEESSPGRGGKKYYIYVRSLPVDVQVAYYYKYYDSIDCHVAEAPRNDGVSTRSRCELNEEFILLYNARWWPELYKSLGQVSIRSLYRWQKELSEGNNDYTVLMPAYQVRCSGEIATTLLPVEQHMALKLMLNPAGFKLGYAYRLALVLLMDAGLERDEISGYGAWKRYIDMYKKYNKNVWVLMREGQKVLREKCIPSIMRDPSKLEIGQYWVSDGHKLDFQIINPYTGKPCRPILVGYTDFVSNGFCGWDLMLTENRQVIASALRNSIISMGRVPDFAQIDNGRAFRAKFFEGRRDRRGTTKGQSPYGGEAAYPVEDEIWTGVYAQLGIQTIISKPYGAQAKKIERVFKEFAQTISKLVPSYRGNSIENQPAWLNMGEKWHRALHHKYIPTLEEANIMIGWWIENFYHKQPCKNVSGKTIGEALEMGRGPGVDVDQLDELMMEQKISKIYADGIRFLNMYYWHDVLVRLDDKVKIKYSLFDLSRIKVYTLKGEYICEAETRMKYHPAASYLGDAADKASLDEAIKQQNRLIRDTKKSIRKYARQQNNLLEGVIDVDFERLSGPSAVAMLEDKLESENNDFQRQVLESEYQEAVKSGRINIPEDYTV